MEVKKSRMILFLCLIALIYSVQYATVYYEGEYKIVYDVIDKEQGACWGEFDDTIKQKGWDFLSIETPLKRFPDSVKAYCVGYLEGVLSQEKIRDFYFNARHATWKKEDNYTTPAYLRKYFTEQRAYTKKIVEENKNDEFFKQIGLIDDQMQGMIDGFNDCQTSEEEKLDYVDFQTMNSGADLYELEYYGEEGRKRKKLFDHMNSDELMDHFVTKTHCSAIFKILDNNEDIFFAHNTWDTPINSLRIFKQISLNTELGESYIQFSSSPASISSVDDWYVTNHNLAIIETTNGNFNDELYKYLTPKSLLYWQRIMVSNRIAKTPKEWMKMFGTKQGGTYCNQYMVLDLNLWKPGQGFVQDTEGFYIGEQYSAMHDSDSGWYYEDKTKYIQEQTYHPSYNVPMYSKVSEIMGYPQTLKKHPELAIKMDYNHCARANIFRREHSKVTDLISMKRLMRLNDYKNDPFAHHDASYQIASRYEYSNISRCHDATDAKLSSAKLYNLGVDSKSYIIGGPTKNEAIGLPPFSWKDPKVVNACCSKKPCFHRGQPEVWDFEWQEFRKHKVSMN